MCDLKMSPASHAASESKEGDAMSSKASRWNRVKLRDCAAFQEGYVNPSQTVPQYFNGEVKWLRAVDLNNSYVWDTSRRLSREGYDSAGKSSLMFKPGTLAISKSGTIGRLGILKDYMCGNRAVINIQPNEAKCDTRFLFYWLLHHRAEIVELAEGSVQKNLYISILGDAEITLPPLTEQRAISGLLGALDDKVELNRHTNETLEAIALAIFKSWFVDFDPVRAKAEGRENSLAEHVADVFPGNFVDSELGPIPGGWDVGTLYDRADYINGLAFRSEDFSQGRLGLPVIKIGELKDGITSQTRFTLKDLDPKYQIKSGDILFAWSGSPDTSIDIFIWSGIDGWLNQHIFKIEAKQSEERIFLYFLLRFFKPVFIEVARNKQTTGLGHVTAGDLRRLKTPVPSKDALRAFNRVAEPLFQRAYCCNQESVNLSAIRDALLPKLVSGEIRIRQGEKVVEVQP
jgi:type I restriction enzyme, S subunit